MKRILLCDDEVKLSRVLQTALTSAGCLTLKAEHNELAARVTRLDQATGDRGTQLDEKLAEADRKLAELQTKLDQAETLLRGSQAGIGGHGMPDGSAWLGSVVPGQHEISLCS